MTWNILKSTVTFSRTYGSLWKWCLNYGSVKILQVITIKTASKSACLSSIQPIITYKPFLWLFNQDPNDWTLGMFGVPMASRQIQIFTNASQVFHCQELISIDLCDLGVLIVWYQAAWQSECLVEICFMIRRPEKNIWKNHVSFLLTFTIICSDIQVTSW